MNSKIPIIVIILILFIILIIQIRYKIKKSKLSTIIDPDSERYPRNRLIQLLTDPIDVKSIKELFSSPVDMSEDEIRKTLLPLAIGDIRTKFSTTTVLRGSQYPNWMSKIKPETALVDIAIPGTNNSLTYSIYKGLMDSWIQTQDPRVYYQLMDGIRYLDLSLCRKEKDPNVIVPFFGKFKCTRDNYDAVCQEIIKFIDENPSEIIIIKLSVWKGDEDIVTDKTIKMLGSKIIKPLKNIEGDGLYSITPRASLEELRKNGNIMIISNIVNEYFYLRDYLFDPKSEDKLMVTQDQFEKIIYDIYSMETPPENSLTVMQANPVFSFWDVFEKFYTNRRSSEILNKALKNSITNNKISPPLSRKNFNIISVDFYQIYNINKFVIELNFKQNNFKPETNLEN